MQVADNTLRQDQSMILGGMIEAMMQKLTISYKEEATTDVQIKFPVGDISDGHHKSRC